jgi:hypothetical protein
LDIAHFLGEAAQMGRIVTHLNDAGLLTIRFSIEEVRNVERARAD